MNNLTPRAYFKSMLFPLFFLIVFATVYPIVLNIKVGVKAESLPLQIIAITLFVPLMIFFQCWIAQPLEKCRQSFKLSIVTGFFSGIILTLAARTGVALRFLLLSADRNVTTLIHIFTGFWQLYLWMALLGIVCMLIDPFFRIVLHRDVFAPRKPSSFYMKYSPRALIYRFVFRKEYPWQNDTDSGRNNTDLDGKDK